jgi:hypothetical protein
MNTMRRTLRRSIVEKRLALFDTGGVRRHGRDREVIALATRVSRIHQCTKFGPESGRGEIAT